MIVGSRVSGIFSLGGRQSQYRASCKREMDQTLVVRSSMRKPASSGVFWAQVSLPPNVEFVEYVQNIIL